MLPLFLVLALAQTPAAPAGGDKGWHRAVGLLQYVEGDYAGAVASGDPGELEEQRAFAKEAVAAIEALGPAGVPFLARAKAIEQSIQRAERADQVPAECGALAKALIQASGLSQAPKRLPDLARGAQVWAANCQTCHGPNGDGDTVTGKALKPPPANFRDPDRMAGLTAYKAFNTTSFGVLGTAMPPFPALSDDDRWAVAFYVFTFRQPACQQAAPAVSLEALATHTDAQLSQSLGEANLACVRRAPTTQAQSSPLARAREGVLRSQAAFAAGNTAAARTELIDAYLEGVEPVEPLLKARDAHLVSELESAFAGARQATQTGTGFAPATAHLLTVIARAEDPRSAAGSFWGVFFTAALILLREGFEAMVVVAALLAVLKKMGAVAHARTVHAGWMSALVVGGALYFFGQELLAGAQRERLETYVAFAAVAMLLYAALWLNARASISQHMGELRGKMQQALSNQSAAGLFAIAFSAVLRETAETALFLQGLAVDSRSGTAWGAVAGLVALAALVGFVSRAGFKLPMKSLFNASTGLLVATAVVLLGKGVHGLQELGSLSLVPMPMLDVELLGLFPDAWPTLAQAVLLAAIAGYAWLKRRPGRPLPTVIPGQG